MRSSIRPWLLNAALLLLCLVPVPQVRAQAAAARDTGAIRTLFIGNSYTYFNDLPSVVGDLAAAAKEKRAFVAEQVLFGGHTIEMHLRRPEALAALRRGGWNLVVLQEQSTRPIDAPQLTMRDVPRIAGEAKAIGASLMLYLTWARESRPSSQDTLSKTYMSAAAAVDARVAPVGEAWRRARTDAAVTSALKRAGRSLFVPDGSHPSSAGTYLAACVFYATIYGKSPVGLPPISRRTEDEPRPGKPAGAPRDSLPTDLARELQRIAWDVVSVQRSWKD